MEEIIKSLGFGSKKDFSDSLEHVIRDTEKRPVENSEFIGITKNPGYNESSELYTIVSRITFPDRRDLRDITLKKYTKNLERLDSERKTLELANKYVPFKDYSFTNERRIMLFPKMLSDTLGTFIEKNIILTRTSPEATVYDTVDKISFWDQLGPSLDPMILLFDYFPHALKDANTGAKFSEGKDYFKDQDEKFKFIGDFFSEIIDENLFYEQEHKTLTQDRLNLNQNNMKGLFDGSRIVNGCRSMYLGGFFGHPYFDKIQDIETKCFESLMARREKLKSNEILTLAEYSIPFEEFDTGFHLGEIYHGANRMLVLKELAEKYKEGTNDIYKELIPLSQKVDSEIEKMGTKISKIKELSHFIKSRN